MKQMIVAAGLALSMLAPLPAQNEAAVPNVLQAVPYQEAGMGKRVLADRDDILMMQAALKPGQMVPQHNANANVHLLILDGEVVVNLDGKDIPAKKGDLLAVAFKTPMNIKNTSNANATFLIIKTPNPAKMPR